MKQWLLMNLRSLPYLLIFPGLIAGLALFVWVQDEGSGSSFSLFQVFTIIEFFFIPWVAVNMVYLAGKQLDNLGIQLWKQILVKVVVSVAAVLLATGIMELLYFSQGLADDDVIVLGATEIGPVATNFVTNGFLALCISTPILLSQAKRYESSLDLKQKSLEMEKLRKLNTESRLETLQSKLNPHFLYNSLNTLTGLVYDEPAKAEKIILGLSDLFRYSLQMKDTQKVTLRQELAIVKTYLEIEKIRFGNGLEYSIEADDDALNMYIPKFLLQPLVENAIKHGTSKVAAGFIHLKIKYEAEKLHFVLEDNGAAFPDNFDFGFGLSSTVEKLNLLYPGRYELSFRNKPKKAIHLTLQDQITSHAETISNNN